MSQLLEKGRSHSRRKFVFHGHQTCPKKQWRAQEGFTYSDGWLWVVRHVCILMLLCENVGGLFVLQVHG